jgi:hypothetical protein
MRWYICYFKVLYLIAAQSKVIKHDLKELLKYENTMISSVTIGPKGMYIEILDHIPFGAQ